MATLSRKGRGYVIHFRPADSVSGRRGLSVGRSRSHALEIRSHVNKIIAAQIAASPVPDATLRWLNEIGADLHAKLVKKGLARPRLAGTALEVGGYCQAYIDRRDDLKPGTLDKLRQARTWLVRFFGEPRDMRTVTEGEARDWQRWLRKNPHANLSEASADVHVKKARQFWADAFCRDLLTRNPFAKLKLGDQTNTANEYHVPAPTPPGSSTPPRTSNGRCWWRWPVSAAPVSPVRCGR
jgi:hypothetical protein